MNAHTSCTNPYLIYVAVVERMVGGTEDIDTCRLHFVDARARWSILLDACRLDVAALSGVGDGRSSASSIEDRCMAL
jgi:hypothetical protein